MLTIQECKKILNRNGKKYSEKEIEQIRDFLWELAQIGVKNLEKQLADENSSNNEQSQ
ncbi:MAG TPA: hypothetical protein VMV47_07090 [Bacteroidales bacterium]|nr:hypothetical protein [Bacteroidales bacterium]